MRIGYAIAFFTIYWKPKQKMQIPLQEALWTFLISIVYWPLTRPKHAIPKTAEVHILLAWVSLAENMGQG